MGFSLLFLPERARIKLYMHTPEYNSSSPGHAHPKEEQHVHYSWESFVWQLLSAFPVEFDQGYPILRVYLSTADRQLAIDIGDGTVRITYGSMAQHGVTPLAEITFDSTDEGGWTPIEVEYAPEMWHAFTREIGTTHEMIGADEQYYDFNTFAAYVLQLIQLQHWLAHGEVTLLSTTPHDDPDWLYHQREPARESHPVTW